MSCITTKKAMNKESRTHKSLLNAKVNLTFYLLSILLISSLLPLAMG